MAEELQVERETVRMETENLNAYFGKTQALKNITLTIPKNKVL
jgi:ABC-type phosphate transport system ATPase subunit